MTLASGVGQKYTIGDVTSSPTLKQAALNFVRGYRGDFEFLVRMKEVEAMQHTFTDGQTKAVLNCMVHDPQGLRYIAQAEEAEVEQSRLGPSAQEMWYSQEPRPPLSVVRPVVKPASFGVAVLWKKRWLTAQGMSRSHILSTGKSSATYWREEHEIGYTMRAHCGVTRRSLPALSRWQRDTSWALTEEPTKQVCEACKRWRTEE